MLSEDAINLILGIKDKVPLTSEQMARGLTVTFFPRQKEAVSANVKEFTEELRAALKSAGVKIIPYEEALHSVSLSKSLKRSLAILANNLICAWNYLLRRDAHRHYIPLRLIVNLLTRRKRIQPGVSIFALGELKAGDLPIDYTASFSRSFIVSILDMPEGIEDSEDFDTHFDTSLKMFAYHMSHVAIAVSDKKWIVYNFNASHPIYSRTGNIREHILDTLVPKLSAPLRPVKLSEMTIVKEKFDPNTGEYKKLVNDFLEGGKLLEKARLFPPGKRIDDLPFRNAVYRWMGKLHLDFRNGMSYGFLAWQLPVEIPDLVPESPTSSRDNEGKDYYVDGQGDLHVRFMLKEQKFVMKVPEVWVLSQRSGSNKTRIKAEDLVKLGLKKGTMYLQAPVGVHFTDDYKPSFDTKVILAHAVGNAMIAGILKYFNKDNSFAERLENKGAALVHWHGYINAEKLPKGWVVYGAKNPHVACSTAQSAVYALDGKLRSFAKNLADGGDYLGDIHLEPQHGSNILFPSLSELGKFFTSQQDMVSLGNKYLASYIK